jgi:hypothetical protein
VLTLPPQTGCPPCPADEIRTRFLDGTRLVTWVARSRSLVSVCRKFERRVLGHVGRASSPRPAWRVGRPSTQAAWRGKPSTQAAWRVGRPSAGVLEASALGGRVPLVVLEGRVRWGVVEGRARLTCWTDECAWLVGTASAPGRVGRVRQARLACWKGEHASSAWCVGSECAWLIGRVSAPGRVVRAIKLGMLEGRARLGVLEGRVRWSVLEGST